MAVHKCLECRGKVSDKASICPHCGTPVDAAKLQEKRRQQGYGCLAVLGVFAALFFFLPEGNNTSDDASSTQSPAQNSAPAKTWRDRDNSSMAYTMMEHFVEQRLRAPSTADFQGVWSGRGDSITPLSDQRYRIRSYVDAENGFGAKIRTYFHGVIKQVSKDEWQIETLELEE